MAFDSPSPSQGDGQPDTAFVYVIAADRGPVKIGVSKDPARRLVKAQTDNPAKLRVLHRLEVAISLSRIVETRAHEIAEKHHVGGEWYCLTAEEAVGVISLAAADVAAGYRPTLLAETARGKRPRAGQDGLGRMFMLGELSAAQFRLANFYRRAEEAARRTAVLACVESVTNLGIDARAWLRKMDLAALSSQSEEALQCFRLIAVDGRSLGNLADGRAWYRLGEVVRSVIDAMAGAEREPAKKVLALEV